MLWMDFYHLRSSTETPKKLAEYAIDNFTLVRAEKGYGSFKCECERECRFYLPISDYYQGFSMEVSNIRCGKVKLVVEKVKSFTLMFKCELFSLAKGFEHIISIKELKEIVRNSISVPYRTVGTYNEPFEISYYYDGDSESGTNVIFVLEVYCIVESSRIYEFIDQIEALRELIKEKLLENAVPEVI